VRLPHNPDELGVPQLTDPDLVGTDTFPPALDDDETNKRLLFWLRATPRDPTRPLGRALFVGINAAEVIQARTANPEFLGTGNGQAHQAFTLVNRPVIRGSTRIQVEEDQNWVDWQAVDGFEASREDAPHYVLDPEAGTIRFGNGVQGKAPQIGQRIRARAYRYGGGVEGNVGAKAITKVTKQTELSAANPLPARGGAPVEPIADALERIPGEFRRHDRAVTHSDFEELALATPGAGVARADCIPLFHPPTKSLQAAGVVSVVVWPREDRKHPTAPMPDRTLLREVCCWLDARRLITTELYVIPPTYRRVAVAVGLQAKRGYGIEAVRRWVELVIRQYLAPVPPYGPEGRGWPLGRRVYGPELEAAALQVEGVEFLEGLDVAALDPVTQQFVPFVNKPIELRPWEVPELAEITVVQGPPLPPGKSLAPAPSPKVPVPIPTLREEC
jgi:predicted phage baseplate assembly protein